MTSGIVDPEVFLSEPYLYRAFISYSHRDSAWAKWLLSALEGYRVPSGLTSTDGAALPPKLGTFFRDRDDASAATNLAEEIRTALLASQNLIVIASPASARSQYVEQEIRDFAALNAARAVPGRILTLVADGLPAISKGKDPADGECFPWALRGGLTLADGTVMEPLAADARKTGDGKTRAIAKLVSGLLGIRYDSLVRRDLQRQRQRRMWFGATAAALLFATGGTGLKIELDRQEKLELQRQQEQAAREEAVMRAVNTAERAKGFLDRGNTRAALALAQKSRTTAKDLPFIPQVYDVLYTAHVQRARPVNLNIGTAAGPLRRSFHFPIGRGEYISADGVWGAKVWAPTTGITYARDDLDSMTLDPVMAADHSVVLFKGNDLQHQHRFWLKDRSWDKYSMTALTMEGYNPSAIIAVDDKTLIGCSERGVFGAVLPAKNIRVNGQAQDADLAWELPVEGSGCISLAAFGPASILVGADTGEVLQVDTATRQIQFRYSLEGERPIALTSAGDTFKVSTTHVDVFFRRGVASPALVAAFSTANRLSPDGALALHVETGAESPTYVITTLATGAATRFSCSCTVEGFDADNNLITNEIDGAKLRSWRDGTIVRPIFNFTKPVNELRYLEQDKLIAGLRDLDAATIISTAEEPLLPVVNGARGTGTLMSSAQFLDDAHVAVVWNAVQLTPLDKIKTEGRKLNHRLEVHATASPTKDDPIYVFGPVAAAIEAQAVGRGLLLLTLEEDALTWPRRAVVVAPLSKTIIFDAAVLSPPLVDYDRGLVIFETAAGFSFFDLATRKFSDFTLSADMPPRFRFWFVGNDRFYSADNTSLRSVDLSTSPPAPLKDIDLGGFGNFICADPSSKALYLINVKNNTAFYQQWSLESGTLLSELGLDAARSDVFQVIADAEMWIDRAQYAETVSCTGGRLKISSGVGQAVTWDVAAKTVVVADDVRADTLPEDVSPASTPSLEDLADAQFSFAETAAELRNRDGDILARFEADGARFTTGKFLRRRGIVVMGLESGELKAWDARNTEAPIISLKLHESSIRDVDTSPDETQVMTADLGGTVYVLPLPDLDLLERMVSSAQ